ncbi:GNAT family N-acetyltransferase [Hyphomonas oceanitis]|uniref:N-acetyltransferase GCN5 n=1 Tax=Hyphomonas oceanitis SCH89 TaxID=1280953 RepID=A0A059G7G9_9PROT|nr:GNAT family N-acetyltransferase [Hyphomonas oceanitis]KDA02684.1 N-acetyltransferase GCN5 [Hyphomonas oceanitis SCH89]
MIRPYTDHDADAVVSIWRAASERAHPFLSTPFLDAEAENVRNVYPQFADIWVLEGAGIPIGFIALVDAEVGAIFLQPEHHGQGYGRAMMDFAVSKKGAVTLEVFKANAIGRAFYDRYGFRQVGEYVHEASGQETLKLAFSPSEG